MHEFLVSAAAFIVLIGVMVIVHEFGHFIVAKLCGVRVEAFSLGFGPRLFGFKYGETDYKVCLLPLGGFVKMTGEAPEQNLEVGGGAGAVAANLPDDPGAFTSHPRWQRMLIGIAGPCANFALTLGLMFFYFGWINEVPAVMVNTTTVDWVTPGSAAAQAGLEPGDEIVSFDGVKLNQPDWETVFEHTKLNANQTVPFTVNRAGQTLSLAIQVPADAKSDAFDDLSDEGILPEYVPGPIPVANVLAGSPAEKAGLRAGDAIEAVDGHAFHFVNTLRAYMQAGNGKPVALTVLRNGATFHAMVTPEFEGGYILGFDSVPIPIVKRPLSMSSAWSESVNFFESNSMLVAEVLQRLFTHKLSVTQLMGPVGIAHAAGQAAEMKGWFPKFGLAGEISLQLGILNLLPFPILDGGMILLLLIESLMRHDISLVIKERIYQAAFVVLMVFFAFVLFNDVSKLGLFTHIKP